MTVQTEEASSGPYAGAGTTGPFTVDFRFLDNSHLRVVKTPAVGDDIDLVYGTDYSVSGAGGESGSVTTVASVQVGEKLTIVRNVPFLQEADYVNGDPFPAESHELALDLLTMQTQQLKEAQGRSLTLPASATSVSTSLPNPEASSILGWNSDKTRLQNYDLTTLATVVAFGTTNGDLFSGNGLQTSFALSANPGALNNLDISVGGVTQRPGIDYTWTSGTTLTFVAAPPAGTNNILVRYMRALPQGYGDSNAMLFDGTTVGAALNPSVLPTLPTDLTGNEMWAYKTSSIGSLVLATVANVAAFVTGVYTVAVRSGAGAVAQTLLAVLRDMPVSLRSFGAVGNGVAYDDAAVNSWLAFLLATGKPGFVPEGSYRMSGRWLIDLNSSASRTVKITGPGPYRAKFFVESTTSPAASMYASAGFDHFYGQLEGFGFQFDTPNCGFALGLDAFTDAPGNYHFQDMYFGNGNTTNSTTAASLRLNYVFDSRFDNCVAVGKVGYGMALDLRQAQFCTFTGGSYSNASFGVRMRDGTLISNTFLGVDIENVNYCVSQEAANTVKQLFSGGFWDCYRPDLAAIGTACVSAAAGGKCSVVLDNVHSTRAGMELYGGAFLAANAKDANGRVQVRGFYGNSTPSMPGNGVTINNATGQNQSVIIYGGTVSKIFIRGIDTGLVSGSFILSPGDYIAIQYSVAPSWAWFPIP